MTPAEVDALLAVLAKWGVAVYRQGDTEIRLFPGAQPVADDGKDDAHDALFAHEVKRDARADG